MPKPGQLVLLVSPRGKRYLRVYEDGGALHTGDGILDYSKVAEAGFGGVARTHLGKAFRVVRPTLYDLVKGVKRQTQIIYPKEIGYILLKLGIGPGKRIIEAGSGSGSLTVAMSWYAGETGRIYTYERRPEFFKLCRANLTRCGVGDNVEQFNHDIADGFVQTGADALFLDVREPWLYLDQAAAAVAPGASLGFLVPTVNQVSDLLTGLEKGPFTDIEVLEIFLRRYKPVPDRLRPEDRMVAHTGFLIFCREQQPLPAEPEAPAEAEAAAPEEDAEAGDPPTGPDAGE